MAVRVFVFKDGNIIKGINENGILQGIEESENVQKRKVVMKIERAIQEAEAKKILRDSDQT